MDPPTIEKLIDAVHNRQQLWEKKHPDYKNANKKNNQWNEIAVHLNQDGKLENQGFKLSK